MNTQKRNIIIGIVLCVIIICITLTFLFFRKSQKSAPEFSYTSFPTPTIVKVTPSANATASLSFKQISPTSVAVIIDSGAKAISAVQLEIAYDPIILKHISVANGSFFDNPFVLMNKVDAEKKKIFYAVSILPNQQEKTGEGTIIIISYTPNAGVKSQTTLEFLPETKVTSIGVDESILKKATGFTISL